MKYLTSELIYLIKNKSSRRNLLIIFWFLLGLLVTIAVYSFLFHVIMEREGQHYSWITGFYWTLTVMTTLGFGDITFHSDLGRLFSVWVLLTGVFSLLVILPFIFIEFVYEPWMRAHTVARVPRELPAEKRDHIILTHFDIVSKTLINKLTQYKYSYVLIVEDLTEALKFYDEGYVVMLGELSNPETYRKARVEHAAMVAATASAPENTSVCFTVRTVNRTVPVLTTAVDESSKEILKLAGSSQVLKLGEMMGQILARRTNGGDAMAHPVGSFGDLRIAEATPASVMLGKTIRELHLREKLGVTVLGVWERGKYKIPGPDTLIKEGSILLLGGTQEQLEQYDVLFCIYNVPLGPVIIVGGGKVGRATANMLKARELDYRIIEKNPSNMESSEKVIIGDASDIQVLKQAGIMDAPSVVVTTNDPGVNLYLTILLRNLRSDIQIISRAGAEGNFEALHEAGADFVMSYASMGANVILNYLKKGDILMVAEGLDLFKVKVPKDIVSQSIEEAKIREKSGCSIVVINKNGHSKLLPKSSERLEEGAEIILIGSEEAEDRFLDMFSKFK